VHDVYHFMHLFPKLGSNIWNNSTNTTFSIYSRPVAYVSAMDFMTMTYSSSVNVMNWHWNRYTQCRYLNTKFKMAAAAILKMA